MKRFLAAQGLVLAFGLVGTAAPMPAQDAPVPILFDTWYFRLPANNPRSAEAEPFPVGRR